MLTPNQEKRRTIGILRHLAHDAAIVVGAAGIIGVSIVACEAIVTVVVRLCEWMSGDKFPAWFHFALLCVVIASLLALAVFILIMHLKGMRMPEDDVDQAPQLRRQRRSIDTEDE